MLILIFLILSVFFGVLFNMRLRENQNHLETLDKYSSINFSNFYFDAETQTAVLKRVFRAENDIEKKLRMLLVVSLTCFIAAFFQLIVLFLSQ